MFVNGDLKIERSLFENNKAIYFGGGIFSAGQLTDYQIELLNSTFVGNSANFFAGGALFW